MFNKLKFLKKPRYAIATGIGAIILLFIVVKIFSPKKSAYTTQTVSLGNVVQEVDATGNVKPADAVDLGFEGSGKIANINVAVGDKVTAGTILMTLQNGDLVANVISAKAKLAQVLRGARAEDVAVSVSSVDSANTSLMNAAIALANTVNDAYVKTDDAVRNHIDKLYTNPTNTHPSFSKTVVSGGVSYLITASDPTVKERVEQERVTVEGILDSWTTVKADANILTTAQAAIQDVQTTQNLLTDVALAINNLASNDQTANDIYTTYKTDVSSARTTVSTAVSNLQTAVQTFLSAQSSVDIAQRQQDLKQASATPEDIQIQQALVQSAQAAYGKSIIIAPFDGLVTKVVPEVGEIVSPGTPVVSMISAQNLEVEVNIPEADIPKIKVGADADITFDAYGKDFVASSTVVTIDPAATVIEGVPTYRTVLTFTQSDPRIKPGMTANIVVHGDHRDNVIAVPQRAVVTKDVGKVVETVQNGNIVDVPVTTGLRGSDGNIEILSGLSVGQAFIPSPSAQ